MASGVQKHSKKVDGYWHRDMPEAHNNVASISQQPETIFASDSINTQPFKSDNLLGNATSNCLISNWEERQLVCDLTSTATIHYISKILLEENIDDDDEINIYHNDQVLRDTEKSFYEVLGKEYPLSQNTTESCSSNKTFSLSSDEESSHNKCKPFDLCNGPLSPFSIQSLAAANIAKGAEEEHNFVPISESLYIHSEKSRNNFHQEHKKNCFSAYLATGDEFSAKMRSFNGEPGSSDVASRKKRVIFQDGPARNESFDEVLLSHGKGYFDDVISLRQIVQKEIETDSGEEMDILSDKMAQEVMQRESLVDLESLLVSCSGAVSANDHNTAYKLIKKIRKHSTPKGSAYQRLAHYLVDALEARMAGTGSDIYHQLMSNQGSATDLLKGVRIYYAVCPYPRASCFFANETILNISRNSSKIHIIDFGIDFGFQWPSFFESISRWGTKPKIRITGISFPSKGFRPNKGVEDTGRRLSEYAEHFNIRFKYQGIASKWENIRMEDLRLDKEETLIVSSLYCFRNLGDETISMDSARDKVLRLIRKIKPRVFIHGIINASYSNPYFTVRFKDVLSSFFPFFDMFDATMPRDNPGRLFLERNFVSTNAMNVIACEGSERVERPEKYRQWEARNLRAGFAKLPVDSMIKNKIERTVKGLYHKDFVVDEENQWVLLGWKGSMIYAMSTWKPN